MLAYYLDEPLSPDEIQTVIEQINSISQNKIYQIICKPLIDVMPANDTALSHAEIIKQFEAMLIKIDTPTDKQSSFILPKGGLSWGMLLQIAFKNVSNRFPFVIQPWEMGSDRIYQRRARILVTDINSAMGG